MKNIHLWLVAVFIVALTGAVQATDIDTLNPIKRVDVKTKLANKTIAFNATLPPSYDKNKDKKYVLFIDFHPRSQPLHAGMHDWMSHNGAWPWLESVIVTPTSYNEDFHRIYMDYVEGKNSHLLDFIEHDLLTTLRKELRLNGFNIYSGFTGNGTTGLSIFLDKPALFNAFIIASPVLKNHPLNIEEKVKAKLTTLTDKPRYVMISMSDSDYDASHIDDFERLTSAFSKLAPDNIQFTKKRFNDHYYMTQPVLAVSHAIEEIFHDVHQVLTPDSAISKQGSQAILAHFDYLSSEKYGFEVSAQPSLKKLGLSLVDSQPEQALQVLQTAVKRYPNSAFAYDALATAYSQLKQYQQAIAAQQNAVKHSEKLVEYWQRKHQKKLEEYQARLH